MRAFTLTMLVLLLAGCSQDTQHPYDPNWGADALVGGKADGLADHAPELTLDEMAREGDVGGDRMELFRIALQRTDRIQLEMEVTSGDLNPHLTLYRGLSQYIGSESWERDGDILRKVYVAEEQGTYFLAARAFREGGNGTYALRGKCLDGPCAGNFPPPGSELELGDATDCITQARRCAFAALPSFDGRVGAARATSIFEACLGTVALSDGSSCADACNWKGPEDDQIYDDARPHCDQVISTLPFYADQSAECVAELDSCFADCSYYDGHSFDVEGFSDTAEAMCFSEGFNGSCDSYARITTACGGLAPEDGYALCEYRCRSVDGAFTDDIQDICGGDADCTSDMCQVDVDAAAAHCGGRTDTHVPCIRQALDDMYSDTCEFELDRFL